MFSLPLFCSIKIHLNVFFFFLHVMNETYAARNVYSFAAQQCSVYWETRILFFFSRMPLLRKNAIFGISLFFNSLCFCRIHLMRMPFNLWSCVLCLHHVLFLLFKLIYVSEEYFWPILCNLHFFCFHIIENSYTNVWLIDAKKNIQNLPFCCFQTWMKAWSVKNQHLVLKNCEFWEITV